MYSHTTIGDLIQESVHTSDDVDIGDVEAVNKDTILVKSIGSTSSPLILYQK
jgi:hypothetical protein